MSTGVPRVSSLRFGVFELDPKSGELFKAGERVNLQPQPSKTLALLARRAGQLVTREDVRKAIWGRNTFVDWDKGINFCLRRIRMALGDNATEPSYIETLPRRGFRFIKAVERADGSPLGKGPPRASEVSRNIVLAVLPFRNLSSDAGQEYFAEGISDALVADLTKVAALRVISRTSAMRLRESQEPLPKIARELKVDMVIEGSVLPSDHRVRITVRLVEAVTDQHLWAETYERDLRDVLSLQGEVARAITRAIKIKLTRRERVRLANRRVVNPDAYQLYLKGRFHLNRWTQEGWRKGIQYFLKAIGKDPTYASAYAALADSYNMLGSTHSMLPPNVFVAKAGRAATKALELDDALAEAHASSALAKWWSFEGSWGKVEDEFRKAISLNPSYADGHLFYSWYLAALERFEESLEHLNRARDLDPLSSRIKANIGWMLYFSREHHKAIAELSETIEMDPNFSLAYLPLGCAYIQLERSSQAISALRKAIILFGGTPLMRAVLAHAHAKDGQTDLAMKVFSELKKQPRKRYVPAYEMCIVYAGLGETKQALDWLERAYDERDTWLVFLKVEPLLDGLRDKSRFRNLLRRIGFQS